MTLSKKSFQAFIILITTISAFSQDLIYSVRGEYNSNSLALDSILFENLSNETRLLFEDLPLQEEYVINLSRGELQINTGIRNHHFQNDYSLVSNSPGNIIIACSNSIIRDGFLSIHNLQGQKLFFSKKLSLHEGTSLNVQLPENGLFIVTISTTISTVSYKAIGSRSIKKFEVFVEDKDYNSVNKLKSSFIRKSDFSFTEGDRLRIRAFRNGLYSNPAAFHITSSDTIDFVFKQGVYSESEIEIAYPDSVGELISFTIDNDTLYCEKINGEYIFQGDIILTEDQIHGGSNLKGIAISSLSKLWPEGKVYYKIHDKLDRDLRIEGAIEHWEDVTSLKFIERVSEENYVEFIVDDKTWSNTGMIKGRQLIGVSNNAHMGHVMHEIGHTIGLVHEHSRPDRDHYININYLNIKILKVKNFNKYHESVSVGPFDFKSIMMYRYDAFARDMSKPVISKIDGSSYTYNRLELSVHDRLTVEYLYGQKQESFIDNRDGNEYKFVTIGDQTWMAENLRATQYPDGSPIDHITDSDVWNGLGESEKAYCWYNNDISNGDSYGALYTWAGIMNGALSSEANPSGVQGVCPDNWHLPSDAEWKELEKHLGISQAELDIRYYRGTDEGGKLKESGVTHWSSPNLGASNESGFTALPGGYKGSDGIFYDIGGSAHLWSATEISGSISWRRSLTYDHAEVFRDEYYKPGGMSVRCVKDRLSAPIVNSISISQSKMEGDTAIFVLEATGNALSYQWQKDGLDLIDIERIQGSGNDTLIIYSLVLSDAGNYRCVVSNDLGIVESDVSVLVVNKTNVTGTITDSRDGNVYKSVKIGDQTWMAENLAATKYRNGNPIPLITSDSEWSNLNSPGYCWYDNDKDSYSDTYGALYSWHVVQTENICPTGWHVPSDLEWIELTDYVAANGHSGVEGIALKATSSWISNNGSDIYGFAALAGGVRNAYGTGGSVLLGYYGIWWSSTEGNNLGGWTRVISSSDTSFGRGDAHEWSGNSIRCIKN